MTIDPDTGIISWTPKGSDFSGGDIVYFEVNVSDGRGGSAEQEFSIQLLAPEPSTTPFALLQINATPDPTNPLEFDLEATADYVGDASNTLTYTWETLGSDGPNSDATFTPSNGTVLASNDAVTIDSDAIFSAEEPGNFDFVRLNIRVVTYSSTVLRSVHISQIPTTFSIGGNLQVQGGQLTQLSFVEDDQFGVPISYIGEPQWTVQAGSIDPQTGVYTYAQCNNTSNLFGGGHFWRTYCGGKHHGYTKG